jgi:hypothetical protein
VRELPQLDMASGLAHDLGVVASCPSRWQTATVQCISCDILNWMKFVLDGSTPFVNVYKWSGVSAVYVSVSACYEGVL